MMSELATAREAQKAAKLKQRADVARVEHDEFMRVLAVNRAKEAEEMQMAATQVGVLGMCCPSKALWLHSGLSWGDAMQAALSSPDSALPEQRELDY